MQRRNNEVNVNILGLEVLIMRHNQAQEVALVNELSKPVPALFHPQVRDMHARSRLQIRPPPHQWNKDTSLKSCLAGSRGAETMYCFLKKGVACQSQDQNA